MPPLWENPTEPPTITQTIVSLPTEGVQLIEVDQPDEEKSEGEVEERIWGEKMEEEQQDEPQEEESEEEITFKDCLRGPWMDPSMWNTEVENDTQRC